ncbi:MAG: CotH kinase family protein, partial [Bacteroidetes bacterium]|nr:CotH kinase family protein [Bacteroidota bacterium]
WGVYNMREKINEHYIASNHNVDKDSIDLLEYQGTVMTGSNENFLELTNFIINNNMSLSSNYAKAEAWIDMENFIDYFSMEIYINNWDWLPNNVRYWREQKEGAKWRYILWDLDLGMGGVWGYTASTLDSTTAKFWEVSARMFTELLKNMDFRNAFINRHADLLNTAFTPKHFGSVITAFRDSIDEEMPRHFDRWGLGFNNPAIGRPGYGTYNGWKNTQIPNLHSFVGFRQITDRNQIEKFFALNAQTPITLKVFPEGAGTIQINTVEIDTFPWAGIYFDGVPITVTAIPNPGYEFSFWQSNVFFPNPDNNISLTYDPTQSDVLTAYFFGSADIEGVTINEINYNSSVDIDAGDWIEIYNYGSTDMNLGKWVFKDDNNQNFYLFPENVIVNTGDYIILSADTAKFKTIYPNVKDVYGPFNFGLNSNGERLRLMDDNLDLYLDMTYGTSSPWPDDATNTGRTLELIDPQGDLNDPYNWFAGCLGGSPGSKFVPCSPVTEVEEILVSNFMRVYPNPATNYVKIQIDPKEWDKGPFDFELYDITGRKVYSIRNISPSGHSALIDLEAGMYFYRVSGDKMSDSGKLVIN